MQKVVNNSTRLPRMALSFMNVLSTLGFMFWAAVILGGCAATNEHVTFAPPPPAFNAASSEQVSLNDQEIASIQPAAGSVMATIESPVSHTKAAVNSCESFHTNFSQGEAVAYDLPNGRIGLGVGSISHRSDADFSRATVRFSMSLDHNYKRATPVVCRQSFWHEFRDAR